MVQIRQVAYTVSVHARRRVLHRRAFEVLKEWGASPPAKPAFGYSMAAGDAAMEVFAAQDAIEHYERARSLLAEERRTGGGRPVEPSIPELEHLYTQLGRAYEGADEWGKAKAAYETMLALRQQLGEARLEVLSLNHLAILSFSKQEPDLPKAKALLEEARRVAEEAGLEERLVETECNLVDLMTIWTGEYEHADPLARKALTSARALEERLDLTARALLTHFRLASALTPASLSRREVVQLSCQVKRDKLSIKALTISLGNPSSTTLCSGAHTNTPDRSKVRSLPLGSAIRRERKPP